MASNFTSQAKRRGERNRDKAADPLEELERTLSSAHRTSRNYSRASRTLSPITINNYNFNGDGMTIKGNASLGSCREEPSRPQPGTARPNLRVSQLRGKGRERNQIDDNDSSDESSTSSNRSRESSRSPPARSRPVTKSIDHAGLDEGYGTSTIQGDRSKKGKEKIIYATPPVTVRRNRKAKVVSSESENEDSLISGDETHLAKTANDEEDSEDDEFARRTIGVAGDNYKSFEVKAMLDTGTDPDWISQRFLEELNLKTSKEEFKKHNGKEFRNFQGETFKASGIVELLITSNEFEGVKARKKWFLVARSSTFKIILGKKTIKEEKLLTYVPRETSGDAANVGIQEKPTKKEEAEVARRKGDQDKQAAEQEKKREEKRKARSKEKQEGRTRPANFAPESRAIARRRSRSRSKSPSSSKPSSKPKPKTRIPEQKVSSESLEGTW